MVSILPTKQPVCAHASTDSDLNTKRNRELNQPHRIRKPCLALGNPQPMLHQANASAARALRADASHAKPSPDDRHQGYLRERIPGVVFLGV